MSPIELLEQLIKPLFLVSDTQKRVFWGYLLASAMLAAFLLYRQKKPIQPLMHRIFSRQFWAQESVLLDFKWIFLNNAIWVLLLGPFFGSQIALALMIKKALFSVFGPGDFIHASLLSVSITYTIVLFVVDDFSRFFIHRCYHRFPLLWRFHAIHHSANVLTPFTLYRIHFVEMFFNGCRSIASAGLVGWVFIYCVAGKITPLLILGVSIFSLAFNLLGANLRHSHIWWSFGRWEHWLMSPAQHQIHHSAKPAHYDKNFGVMIPLWDKCFGSWLPSTGETVEAVGLGIPVRQSLRAQIFGIK
jgi:sterol desaturase/sphingolipid hydroxylase (fatty acid hydroxylase superfamily)